MFFTYLLLTKRREKKRCPLLATGLAPLGIDDMSHVFFFVYSKDE